MFKYCLVLVSLMILSGCEQYSRQKQEVVTVKIVAVQKESTEWGCVGTDYKTVVHINETGYRDEMCGHLGAVGDEFKACLVTQSIDPISNGLRRFCSEPAAPSQEVK